MPNEPRGQGAAPDPSPARAPRFTRRTRAAAAAVVVVALVAVLAGVVVGGFGAPGSPVAHAGATATPGATPSATPTATATAPSVPPSTAPTPSPTPSPTTAASPTPSATATPTASPTPAPAVIPAERLQARLDKLRAKLSIPGASVAILWDDGRIWLGASGKADVAAGRPVTTDSGFALASISKTYTAAVVLQLVDEGRLRLDEPVAPLLPDFRLGRRITVRMLLDHTSGLPDFFFDRRIDKALQSAPDARWTAARAWRYVAKKRPAPGTTWAYSNTNYLLLGELVEAVTGRPLAREVRDRLLDPLDLADTWYQVAEKPRAPLTLGYRLLARPGGGVQVAAVAPASAVMPFRSVVTAAGGAGSIASTSLDAARWMQALAGGRVLSPAMQQAMLADAAATAALDARVPYGLGIQVTTLDGRRAIGHSGRYLGYRDVVRYLPDEGVTIAVLTNQGVADPSRIAAGLLRLVLPPLPEPSPSASPAP